MDLAAGVYLSEAPTPPRSSNFVGSESCQIQSVKHPQNMVSNRTQHPTPPPSHTIYTVLCHREGKRGGGEVLNQRERYRDNS
jgi:hypothetical protein